MQRPVLVFAVIALTAACSSSGSEGEAVSSDPSSAPTEVTTAQSATTAPAPATTAPPTTAPATAPPTTAAPTTPATTMPAVPTRPTIAELVSSGRVLNIAHAGGDQEWPHSTFYAYDQSVAAGADILEMDVQLTADGVLIVQHDDTVDGTTNGTGRVDSFTFAEIQQFDAAHWYIPGCWPCRDSPAEAFVFRGVRTGDVPPPEGASADDFRIISFAELVERYPEHAYDVEIKGSGDAAAATAAELATEIEQLGITDSIVVVSFDDPTVELFRSLAPDVEVSPGVAAMSAWLLDGAPLDGFDIVQVPPFFGDVEVINDAFWERVAEAGVTVWMWPNDAATQENAAFYAAMIDQGVTGIIAGRPSEVPT
jgi:glycerophosphoryl diester phosphodiesterase